jgi:hypothetical protein
MKKLALIAIILLAGCAETNTHTAGSDSKRTGVKEKRQVIADRENQCINKALTRSRDEMAHIAVTSDASFELLIQRAKNERDRELLECRATADRENAESSACERNEYALEAQQEHDSAALMRMLTTSRPR